jgi:hypothetical protein
MRETSDVWIKKILLWFLGACCFLIFANAAQYTYVLRKRGIQTSGKIVSVEKAGDYHPYRNNPFHRDRYRLRIVFQNSKGQKEIFEGLMSAGENDLFHAAVGKEAPFIYDPVSKRYVFGTKYPSKFEALLYTLALVPAGITLILWGFFKKR